MRRANASFIWARRARSAGCTTSSTASRSRPSRSSPPTANGSRDPASGEFDREDVDPDAGLNLRLGFTSYALDATLNPDFSQVESDEGQVTVNERFALFFPGEAALLPRGHRALRHAADAGLHPPDRESQGRRQAHRQVRPARRRPSHRGGRDRRRRRLVQHHPAAPRLRPQLDRRASPSPTATRATPTTGCSPATSATSGVSTTPSSSTAPRGPRDSGSTRRAPIWQAEYDRTGRSWGFNYLLKGLGRRLRRPGGVREPAPERRGERARLQPVHRCTASRGALLENLTVFFGPDRTWLYDDFGFKEGIEGFEQVDATFQLRGGWELNGHAPARLREVPGHQLRGLHLGSAAGPAYLPPDDFSGVNWTAQVTTPTWRQLGAELSYTRGRTPLFEEGGDRDVAPAHRRGWSCAPRRPCGSRRRGTVLPALPARRQRVRPRDHSPAPGGVPAQPRALLPRDRRVPLGAPGGAGRPRTRASRSSSTARRSRRDGPTASGWICWRRSSRRREPWRSSGTAARWRPTGTSTGPGWSG